MKILVNKINNVIESIGNFDLTSHYCLNNSVMILGISNQTHYVFEIEDQDIVPFAYQVDQITGTVSVCDQIILDNIAQQKLEEKIKNIKANVITAAQSRLDMFAKTRGYDGIVQLCTYATSLVQKFKEEGQCGVNSRDMTWAKLYEIMSQIESGSRPMPDNEAEILAELPVLKWPDEQVI